MKKQIKNEEKYKKIRNAVMETPKSIDLSADITELFRVNARKKQRISEYMCESIIKAKLKADESARVAAYPTVPSRPTTAEEFREFIRQCPSTEMSRFQERDIRRKIQARGLENSHPQLLADIMKETKEQYTKIIKHACLNLKIKNCYPEVIFELEPYKYLGKTDRYKEYIRTRKQLKAKWILHYPIVKKIITHCVSNLPYQLIHLKFEKVLELNEIEYALKDKAQGATQFVYEFYTKIVAIIDREETKQRKIYNLDYLGACTGILSVQISRAIAHTILGIVKFTASKENPPYLNLYVTFRHGLILMPTPEEIITAFYEFIQNIIDVSTEIYVLERNKVKRYKRKPMYLCLTEEFLAQCKEEIKINIHKSYEPIVRYIDDMTKAFQRVYADINSEDFINSISDIGFETGCEKIVYYKEYLNKAAYIPDYEFFHIGQISLANCRLELQKGLTRITDHIFEKLRSQHLWEVTDICETFKLIYTKATEKPMTTEELVETGKYMNWVRDEHLSELGARVKNSVTSLCQIIELGILTAEHMQLTSTAVNWLDKIKPVIHEYFVNFEQLKFDAEEKLQKVVEDVAVSIKEVYPLLVILDDMDDISRVRSYLNYISLHMSKIKEIEEQIFWINSEEVCLSFPKSTYAEYEFLKDYVYPFYHLLKMCLEVQRNVSVWQDGQFESLNYEPTKTSVDAYYKELTDLYKSYRKTLRKAQDENLPIRFKGTVDDPDILNWPAPLKLCGKAMKLLDEFKPSVAVMKIICNKSLRKRHWKAMSDIAGEDITPNAGTTLKKIMKIDFHSNLNEYEIISAGASKEKRLIDRLENLKLQWEDIVFTVTKYKQTNIVTHLEDIEALIDDHSIQVLNMKGSVFVRPHEVEANKFYEKILMIERTIEKWADLQAQWISFYPVFSTDYLRSEIPTESELFDKVKNVYNTYIDKISEIQTVIKVVGTTNILNDIEICLTQLEIIRHGVLSYLETTRQSFPRFYFLADDELLEIISQKSVLQSPKFLMKLFQGIHQLAINDSEITAMQSVESEIVNFVDAINFHDNNIRLEGLCAQIEHQMVVSLKHHMEECHKTYKRTSFSGLLSQFPQQVIQIISQVYWTENIDSALQLTHNIKLRIYNQKLENSLKGKIRMVNENSTQNLRRLILKNLILNDLNNKYLIQKILAINRVNKNLFEWEAYIRYYFPDGLLNVELMDTKQNYLYEYLGNSYPLILSPSTDRCYRTLINAHYLHFNGLLQGPSESGKSETIKGLAGALGVYFVSFYCPQNLNSFVLETFFRGRALCGAWLCLENLNVLRPDVLSVVSQDMCTILSAVKSGGCQTLIGGVQVSVNPSGFICASMTGVRANMELPENLRVLFRTMTLITPDIGRIVEATLYSAGFENAHILSGKIFCLYQTYQEIFPTQHQKCFSVSNLEQILRNCKQSKLENLNYSENYVVFNSIRTTVIPTLSQEDVKTFEDILKQIFPNTDTSVDEGILEDPILQYCNEHNLQVDKGYLVKVTEIFGCLKGNSHVILSGETLTGKTTALNICEQLFTKLESIPVLHHTVNPNCLSYDILYGQLNTNSHRWRDGVISKIIRDFSEHNEELIKWLIFDGNIDDSWIENINPILAGEKKFYLESGEALAVNKSTSVIFEVKNLNSSSPSTVSRCAMVYMDHLSLTWRSLVKSWIDTCDSEWIQDYKLPILDIFDWIIPPSLDFIVKNCTQLCYPNTINLVKIMIRLTRIILDEAFLSIASKEEDIKNLSSWIQATLIQTGIIGLGSVLDTNSRHKFDEFYRLLWKGQNEKHPYPKSFEKLEVVLPQDGLIFDYQYIYKQRGVWKLYQDILKNEKIVENSFMHEFVVPTVDTLRYNFLLSTFIQNKQPTLLVGPAGTGKSLLIEDVLINKLNEDEYEVSHINFNNTTTSQQLQRFILSKLNKRKAGRYTPSTNKQFLLFIDNLNLLPTDKDGTSSCFELLRQHLDHKVWYDFKSCGPIHLDNVNIVSAMSLTESRKQCQRFLRHFDIFCINEFSCDTISRIYSNALLHVWKKAGFPGDINTIVTQIITATLRVYKSVIKKLKPTISLPFYHFNLGDFTKVIRGCGSLKKETYDLNKKIYLKLWSHEILRVLGDRLQYVEANWLLENIKQTIKEEFNEEIEDIFDMSSQQGDPISKLVFGTFNDLERPECSRRYEEITDLNHLSDVVKEFLRDYNIAHDVKLDITFASYALDKLTKICRILSISPGNALLLGLSGSGRQSLTKLAAFIYKQKLFQPTITQNYTISDWNKDFKEALRETGGLGSQCVFLVSEEHLVDEQFLQNIDWLLRHGEIPDLYDTHEKQDILELARLAAQGGNRNLDISSSSVFLYFNKRCRENLHLILSLSVCDTLRIRIRNHPSLTQCHIIWFEDWPDEVLEVIGQNWIEDMKLPQEEIKKNIVKTFIFFHRESQDLASNSKLHVHITSRSFKHLIKLFIELITNKQTEINSLKKRYQQGLAKLTYAANQIIRMQNALAEYQPQLEAMTRRAVEMTDQIALETIEVEKASDLVRTDEKIASEQATVAQILKSECESELAQAIPILEDAISALNTLKPSDITLVKSMKNPPDAIKLVMAAVCVIKDVKPDRLPDPSTGRKTIDYWGPSKRILGDMNFLQLLKEFDKDNIKPEIMVKIRKDYLPHKDFKPHVVAKASSAAEGLCKWIIAMDMYDKVAKEVAPKKEKLEKAEKEYAETVAILNAKKEEVTRIEEKLAHLNDLLEEANQKQVKLQREVDYCNKKLNSAQNLIDSLSGENIRWTEAVENLETQYNALLGNVLISCGIIAYLAPFKDTTRETITIKWHKFIKEGSLPCSEEFDMLKTLGPETKTEFWQRNGLPQDYFFLVNAVIKEFSRYYSIFIDPQYLASSWIKHIERRNNLTIARFNHPNYLDQLKQCVSAGKPILIEKIKEYIPPCLSELLSNQIYIKDEETFVKLNNEYIKLNKNFRLYMICNLRFPCFAPPVYNRMTLINFTITERGLERHLLKIVTEVEKPELKKLKKELYSRNKKNTIELSQLEDKILGTLCESDSDILEDEASIKILDQSKDLAKTVREKQEKVRHLQTTITTFNSGYVSIAKYAANLFPCVYEMKNINFIYEFPFDLYMDLYFKSILKSEKSVDRDRRCENIKDCFTFELYTNITRSLFKKDQLTFLFLLTTRVLLFKKQIRYEELIFFLTDKFAERETTYSNPAPQWISGKIWKNLCQIETLPEFDGFLQSFIDQISTWKSFFEEQNIELDHFPLPWNTRLNNLLKLILLKILRIEQLFRNITKFVSAELGRRFVQPRDFNLSDIYNESYSLSPILFILVAGSNPTRAIRDLAAKKKVLNKFRTLTLGDDRIVDANDLFEEAVKKGSWLLLENCHLVPQWLSILEQKVAEMNFENTHENFRLWLTTEASQALPKELLQASVKVIDETPEGLKENLLRLYKKDPINESKFYKGCPGKQEIFTKLLYGLSFFHCILQQKRKYGMFGWSAPYHFNDADMIISLHQLQNNVNDANFDFKCLEKLTYIIGRCHYSGLLDNEWDIRLLVTLVNDCLNTDMIKSSTYLFNDLKPYGLPTKKEYKDYLHYISNLPQNDLPEIFGLSEFLVASSTVKKSSRLIASSLDILRETNTKDFKDYEGYLLTNIDELLKKLPTPLHLSVENSFLANEIKHYNNLLAVIKQSLHKLGQAFAGDITISSEFEETARSILHNSVPKEWMQFSYPHEMNLPNYIENLCQRIEYFKKNLNVNRYWLSAFFFPKALICQAKLNFSRLLGIPLEYLTFDHEVLISDVPESNGIVLEGFYIIGAKWDHENSILAELSASLYEEFPPVLFKPISIVNYSESSRYSCPIYQIQGRITDGDFLPGTKNFIIHILLPTEVDHTRWIKRGVKMVCQVPS